MNDLTAVVATLIDAIETLQSRAPHLAPLEKLKLKALRLNLEAARAIVPPVTSTATIYAFRRRGEGPDDPLGERVRAVQSKLEATIEPAPSEASTAALA